MPAPILAFDLYGTILDTSSIKHALPEILPLLQQGNDANSRLESIVKMWRTEQLEYTWRLNSMESYLNFEEVTKRALQATLLAHSLPVLSEEGLTKALKAYNSLSPFPGAEGFFSSLASRGTKSVIFTNGTREMATKTLLKASTSDTFQALFLSSPEGIISVDDAVRRFKPSPAVYEECVSRVGAEGANCMILVSCNPFDVVGAMKCGWRVIWIDRAGKGWTDRLGEEPTWTVKDLGEIMWVLEECEGK